MGISSGHVAFTITHGLGAESAGVILLSRPTTDFGIFGGKKTVPVSEWPRIAFVDLTHFTHATRFGWYVSRGEQNQVWLLFTTGGRPPYK